MSKEAIKMALEALNKLTDAAEGFSVSGVYFNEGVWEKECLNTSYAAIKALEEALSKQEQGEPVAWMRQDGQRVTTASDRHNYPDYETRYSIPLYTTPQQRKPLTDEEIEKCYETTGHYQTLRPQDGFAVFALARAIEAAHGIKE
jgi:hypothetical protein